MTTARVVGRWLLAGVVFVAVLEVCIRVEDRTRWDAPLLGPYSHDLLTATDSIGRRNRPDTQFEKWTVNRWGFRGPEIEMTPPQNKRRIAVVGASETFGLYESQGHEFPAQMQNMLDRLDPGAFQVVNTAVPGASPPHMADYYQRWVSRFKPDVVVIYPSAAFYLDNNPPRLPSKPPRLRDPMDENRYDLRVVSRLENKLKRFLPAALQTRLKEWGIERQIAEHGQDWVFQEVPGDRLETFRQDLVALVEAVESSGARVVLGTHANRFSRPLSETERTHLIGWRRFLPRAGGELLIDWGEATNEVIRDVAVERGISLADVARAIPKRPENFADFSHFTDAGAEAAAQAFVRTLLQTSLVEAGTGAG